MTIRLWIIGLLDQWIVGAGNAVASGARRSRAATVRERNQPVIPVRDRRTAPSRSGLCYFPPIQNSIYPIIFHPPAPAFAPLRLRSNSATSRAIFAPGELSPRSALMGGQFTTEKRRGAFKNPMFYAGKFPGIFSKNELSLFNIPKSGFLYRLTTFFGIAQGIAVFQTDSQ